MNKKHAAQEFWYLDVNPMMTVKICAHQSGARRAISATITRYGLGGSLLEHSSITRAAVKQRLYK